MSRFAMNFGHRMQRPHRLVTQAQARASRAVLSGCSASSASRTRRRQALRPTYRASIAAISRLSHRAPSLRTRRTLAVCVAGRTIGTEHSRSSSTAPIARTSRARAAGFDALRCASSKIDNTASSGVIGGKGSGSGRGMAQLGLYNPKCRVAELGQRVPPFAGRWGEVG